MLLSVFV